MTKSGGPIYDQMEDVEPLGAVPNDYSTVPEPVSELKSMMSRPASPQEWIRFDLDEPSSLRSLVSRFSEHLSEEQTNVLREVARGTSVFFTGSAGTGKTVVLRAIIAMLNFKHFGEYSEEALAVTAPTGISALNVGGQTLHSFAGVGLAKKPLIELMMMVMKNKKALERWKRLRTLIIDEISMVDGTFFDKLEAIARCTRNNEHPFGGVQLIICGDFFQLPPVPDDLHGCARLLCFAFEAAAWRKCIQRQMLLTQVFRQTEAPFIKLLNQMRLGVVNPDLEILRHLEREVKYTDGIEPIQLFPRRRQVALANKARLEGLRSRPFVYNAVDQGRFENGESDNEAHRKRITELLDKHSSAPRRLTFKKGAQVMLTKNLVQGYLVNGSSGRVLGFSTLHQAREVGIENAKEILERSLKQSLEDVTISNKTSLKEFKELRRLEDLPVDAQDNIYPIVQFTNGRKVVFSPLPMHLEDAAGHLEATRVQLPLVLAWALSIHKCQGQTLQRVKIDLDGTFDAGQAYVAVSRSTGMETLQVLNFNPVMVRAHPRVVEWYEDLMMGVEMDDEEAVKAYFSHF